MSQQAEVMRLVRRKGWIGWFIVRRRHMGYIAFALNRLTGLGLVIYLFLHLGVLTILVQGPTAWDTFIRLAKTPFFLLLDVILLFGILYHGLNGLRLILVGLGIGAQHHKAIFWILMGVAAIALILGTWGFLVI